MERQYRRWLSKGLGVSRSRRQVLGTAAKGTIGGLGATLVARGLVGTTPGVFAPTTSAQGTTCEAIPCASPAELKIRPNVFDLTERQIKSLRRGVAVMKARAESNPTSWLAQANLHAEPAILDPVPTWCQHASWFFFPWHRMYLYWFEQILRDASDDPDLMLPYWNYTDNPEHRTLPDALRARVDADGNVNPLFEPRRNPLINQGWGMPASSVETERSFARTNFFHDPNDPAAFSFGGARTTEPAFYTERDNSGTLEGAPHGPVHNFVGGPPASFSHIFTTSGRVPYSADQNPAVAGEVNVITGAPTNPVAVTVTDFGYDRPSVQITTGTTVTWSNEGAFPHAIASDDGTTFDSNTLAPVGYMRSLLVSARDPIFWMHHANIDRLWNRWLEPRFGGSNPPTTEVEWMDQDFTFFKPDRSSVSMCVKDVLSVYCLGYRYDDDPETEPAPVADVGISAQATPAARREPRVTALGENSPDETIELGAERFTTTVELDPPAEAALTRIARSEATPVAGAVDPRIALTLEGIQDTGSPGVIYEVYVNLPPDTEPDYRSEYFVGLIDLFGLTAHPGHRAADRQSFDITPAVRSVQERGEQRGELTITFVAQGLIPPEGQADTPTAGARSALTRATPGSWVTIERVTVAAVE
jgi:hypothetical protein